MTTVPQLSILIPTADRQDYAVSSVAAVAIACPDAEIVVSDTSAEEGLEARLMVGPGARQLRYLRPGAGIDVVSNFNRAAEAATGRWLMFIGDDDGVGPGIRSVVDWAERRQVDAVVSYGPRFHAIYYWPGVTSRYFGDGYAARLIVNRCSGKARMLDARAAMLAALRDLGSGLGWMPRAYHGLVSRDVVDRIVEKHGALFGGVSPDIYSATMISEMARKPAVVEWPFVLPGASPKSTAGLGAAQTDRSSLWNNPHIAPFRNLTWDPLIPEFYSPTVVWAYSFKKAVDATGDPSLVPNLARLYARSLLHNRAYAGATLNAMEVWGEKIGWLPARAQVLGELMGEGLRFTGKAMRRLARPTAQGAALQVVPGLPNVEQAYRALENICRDIGSLSLDD